MATWGGSTVDNLESIEEDGGNSGDGQEAEECVDDGYPSDGIVQVEEEEEQDAVDDNSDDRDTYTIEEEPYATKARQPRRTAGPDGVDGNIRPSKRGSSSKGAPFQGQGGGEPYNYWAPNNNQVLNNVRSSTKSRSSKKKKDKETSAMKEELESVKEQISGLKDILENMNRSSNPVQNETGFNANMQYMASLQQQQMFLSVSQLHNQLLSQQQEMGDRLGRLEHSFSSSRDNLHLSGASASERRSAVRSHDASPREAAAPSHQHTFQQQHKNSLQNLPHYLDNYSSPYGPHGKSGAFELRPQFPDAFTSYPLSSESASMQNSPYMNNNSGGSSRSNRAHNTNNNHVDALRLESILQREMSERNPFTGSPYSDGGEQLLRQARYVVRGEADEPDAVPIETIQAQDTTWGGSAGVSRAAAAIATAGTQAATLDDMVRAQSRRFEGQGARPKQNQKSGSSRDARVIGQRFPTPSRANAAAKLASQKINDSQYRSGVHSMKRNTDIDAGSVSSVVSSVPGAESTSFKPIDVKGENKEPDESGDYSLFEALRETIYSEVATLISQNEARPHYLIEMFRELQCLTTDYLRQRALYAVQELVTQYQTEESLAQQGKPPATEVDAVVVEVKRGKANKEKTSPHRWEYERTASNDAAASNMSDDEIRARLYAQIPHLSSRLKPGDSTAADKRHVGRAAYDYAEKAENTSTTVDTPESAQWELPFAQDTLGETVVNLDKALQRMREYERRLTNPLGVTEGASPANFVSDARQRQSSAAAAAGPAKISSRQDSVSSSAQDNGSEGSVSDVPYPRIDTRQLDFQIKGIMTEIIPVLKEHMDDVCSQQLLQYIKRLVLSLTKHQDDQGQEFVRFFHKQLGSILQDSLSKFDGRKMRDCGEDLLIDLSEILFNELAFFRLMQDLDNPEAKARANAASYKQSCHSSSDDDGSTDVVAQVESAIAAHNAAAAAKQPEGDIRSCDETDTEASSHVSHQDNEGEVEDGSTVEKQDLEGNYDDDSFINDDDEEEEEHLGNTRDDEMASQVVTSRDDQDQVKATMRIQLAPSETKAMNIIGSDEDDEGEDEDINFEDPSDTAVSHDYGSQDLSLETRDDDSYQPSPLIVNGTLKEDNKSRDNEKEIDTTEASSATAPTAAVTPANTQQQQLESTTNSSSDSSDKNTSSTTPSSSSSSSSDGGGLKMPETPETRTSEIHDDDEFVVVSPPGGADIQSPESVNNTVIEVNGEVKENGDVSDDEVSEEISENIEEEEGEDDEQELTIDDLPQKLSGLTKQEDSSSPAPDIVGSAAASSQLVLDYINDTTRRGELAGDAAQLKQPGTDNNNDVTSCNASH